MKLLNKIFDDSIKTKVDTLELYGDSIIKASELVYNAIKNDNKILICGNGGSAADSQHFAAEFVVRFKNDRDPLPSIALTTDSSILTAASNDYDFSHVFSRQVKALGKKNDILIAISTSGNSKNIIEAIKVSEANEIKTILLTGKTSGKCSKLNIDQVVNVCSDETARIQETHILILHFICTYVESKILNE